MPPAVGQQRAASVVVAPVIEESVAPTETFVATILPDKKAVIGTAVDGRVIEILVEEGDRVKANQPLAQLLTDTISLELAAAEAELDYRRQQLAELENGTRPAEIERAKALMLAAEAVLNYQQARRARIEKLFSSSSAISEEERDEAVSAAIGAEQLLIQTRAAYQLAVEGPRKEQIAQARAQVHMQEATAEKLSDQVKKHTIISRFDGYVTAKLTEVGQWVTRGDPVIEVVALDTVEVQAFVLEKHVPFIHVGQAVSVEVPAVPGQTFAGKVALVIPEADARARTFPVKVRVTNIASADGPVLKAGMYARVTLPTAAEKRGMLVSKDAIVLGGTSPMVYVVDLTNDTEKGAGETGSDPGAGAQVAQAGKVRPVPVSTGEATGNLLQVQGQLQVGQFVVVKGNERLRPGQEIVIAAVEAPRQSAAAGPAKSSTAKSSTAKSSVTTSAAAISAPDSTANAALLAPSPARADTADSDHNP
jgi:RND family efflux transporter MFP subunit